MGSTVSLDGLFYGLCHLFCFLCNFLFPADEICDLLQIIQDNNRKHVGRDQIAKITGIITRTETGPDQTAAIVYQSTLSSAA